MNVQRETEVATEKLVEDFRAVVSDTEELLRATANQTGERIAQARSRVEESLRESKRRLEELEDNALERARVAAKRTDEYVREHPWESIGIAGAVGVLFGMLISRR
jgi:ElaB/YqjD/DUF883 family membrane-anchored ribosome-binding protein